MSWAHCCKRVSRSFLLRTVPLKGKLKLAGRQKGTRKRTTGREESREERIALEESEPCAERGKREETRQTAAREKQRERTSARANAGRFVHLSQSC